MKQLISELKRVLPDESENRINEFAKVLKVGYDHGSDAAMSAIRFMPRDFNIKTFCDMSMALGANDGAVLRAVERAARAEEDVGCFLCWLERC